MKKTKLSLADAAKAVRKGVEDRNFSKAQDAISTELDEQIELSEKKKAKLVADLEAKKAESKEDFDESLVSDFNSHAGKAISTRVARCAYAKEFVKSFGSILVTIEADMAKDQLAIDKLNKEIEVFKKLKDSVENITVYVVEE